MISTSSHWDDDIIKCVIRGGRRPREPRIKGPYRPSEEAGGSYSEAADLWHAPAGTGGVAPRFEAPAVHSGPSQVSGLSI